MRKLDEARMHDSLSQSLRVAATGRLEQRRPIVRAINQPGDHATLIDKSQVHVLF